MANLSLINLIMCSALPWRLLSLQPGCLLFTLSSQSGSWFSFSAVFFNDLCRVSILDCSGLFWLTILAIFLFTLLTTLFHYFSRICFSRVTVRYLSSVYRTARYCSLFFVLRYATSWCIFYRWCFNSWLTLRWLASRVFKCWFYCCILASSCSKLLFLYYVS